MKATVNITIGVLLAVVLLAGSAKAGSTGELLQQGLYAEEVDGDIDAAIRAYEQVIQDGTAPRNHVAQALYRQGVCYVKIRDDASAREVLEKLTTEYADQTEIVEKAQSILDDLLDFDPATLMPPDTLVYVELGSPGRQVETILNMLKGTPFENPLAAIAGGAAAEIGQKSPADIMAALLNPSMMAEFKKIKSSAIGVTGIAQNNPPMILVLYPGKSDALRGMILAGLSMAGQPGEPLEGMQTLNIQNAAAVAHDDKVIIITSPPGQLPWCVRQYKGLASEPTLASSNPSFSKLDKKQRRNNALTVWANVDQVYAGVLQQFSPGRIPQQVRWADAFVDFGNIDSIILTVSIESDGITDTDQVLLKDGHRCLVYDIFRTPNINPAALEAVPSDAVALVSFALSPESEVQADTLRTQIKNVTGLDIGREIFANIEQVTVFAVQPKKPDVFFPAHMGLVLTSHNPQQTRAILETLLRAGDLASSNQQSVQTETPPAGYHLGFVNSQPVYCYLEQVKNATILSLNPDITQACLAAINEGKSVCKSGPLSATVNKLPPKASKVVAVNVGGAMRIAAPIVIESFPQERHEELQDSFAQLAGAADKTTVEIRTEEQVNSLVSTSAITGLPPLNQVFGPLAQITQIANQVKTETRARQLKKAPAVTIRQASAAPAIDGLADEIWSVAGQNKIANVMFSPLSSPNDLSAYFKAMWDENNLYVLVDVTDDILKNDSTPDQWWFDDSVEVYIDADNSKSNQYDEDDAQYHFDWDTTSPTMGVHNQHGRIENVEFAMVTTENGYRTEIKFPWSTLGVKPFAGMSIGLDVHVDDDDTGGDRQTKLQWFAKQDLAWQNPQLFGTAELSGLVGWWKFDEKEGTNAADSSGNSNSGTLQGNPQWRPSAGKIGGALEFDGDGDFVSIANESKFDFAGQITISAWVNIASVPQEWTAIITKGDSSWRLSTVQQTRRFHFSVNDWNRITLDGMRTVDTNQWHHVAAVYDGSEMRIYVDGSPDVSKPWTGGINANDFPVCIGENAEQTGRFWHGLIDEVRVYNYALSEDEVAELAGAQ